MAKKKKKYVEITNQEIGSLKGQGISVVNKTNQTRNIVKVRG